MNPFDQAWGLVKGAMPPPRRTPFGIEEHILMTPDDFFDVILGNDRERWPSTAKQRWGFLGEPPEDPMEEKPLWGDWDRKNSLKYIQELVERMKEPYNHKQIMEGVWPNTMGGRGDWVVSIAESPLFGPLQEGEERFKYRGIQDGGASHGSIASIGSWRS